MGVCPTPSVHRDDHVDEGPYIWYDGQGLEWQLCGNKWYDAELPRREQLMISAPAYAGRLIQEPHGIAYGIAPSQSSNASTWPPPRGTPFRGKWLRACPVTL